MNLEDRLDRLRSDVTFPTAPAAPRAGWPETRPGRGRTRPLLAVAAITVIMLGVVLVAVPEARSVVARWIDLGAIRVQVVERFTGADDEVAPLDPLIIGNRADLDDVSGVLAIPGDDPDAAYRHVLGNGSTIVTVVYRASDAFPAIEDSDVGVMLTATDAPFDMVRWTKETSAPPGGMFVSVRGAEGVWILAGQLVIERDDPGGTFGLAPLVRRTGHVLIWQEGGITYRMETRLSRQAAIALAESLVPIGEPDRGDCCTAG